VDARLLTTTDDLTNTSARRPSHRWQTPSASPRRNPAVLAHRELHARHRDHLNPERPEPGASDKRRSWRIPTLVLSVF
jgi:hypothetical protein